MIRLRSLAPALAVAALALPLAAQPAAADSPDPTARVTRASLPSVQQVAKIYPSLRGGERDVSGARTIGAPGKDCLEEVAQRGRSGLRAEYAGAQPTPDDSAQLPVLPAATVMVWTVRMKNLKQARRTTGAFVRFANDKRCARLARQEGTSITKVSLGRTGQQRVGLRYTYEGEPALGAYFLHVVRRGPVVTVVTSLGAGASKAATRKSVRLVRLAVRRAA